MAKVKWSRFDPKIMDKAAHDLMEGDMRYDNLEKALPHMTPEQKREIKRALMEGRVPKNYENPKLEILMHYGQIHTVLLDVSRGKLRNQNILQIGAGTGVYTKFLKEYYNSRTIGIDISLNFLKNAINRGARVLRGSVIPSKVKVKHPEKGSVVNHIPIKSGSMDYVLSQHFLFANYSKKIGGIEDAENSTRVSEETLKEIRRVLKPGGRLIVTEAHPDKLEALRKFKPGQKINGFVVERGYSLSDKVFSLEPGAKSIKNPGAVAFVLRKL